MNKLRNVLALLLGLLCLVGPVHAESQIGTYVRSGTSSITDPVANKTWVFDAIDQNLKVWNGASWVLKTPPYSNLLGSGAPTVNQDSSQGYVVGSSYYDTAGKNYYILSDATVGAAVWTKLNGTLQAGDLGPTLRYSDWLSDFVASGLLGSPISGLSMTTPSGVAYVGGIRTVVGSSNYAYTASKDTYDYLQANGSINHIAVNNGDSVPIGQPGLFLQKVVTNGSNVTAVTQSAFNAPPARLATSTLSLLTGTSPYFKKINILGESVSADRNYTVPEVGTAAYFMMGSSVTGTAGDAFIASGSNAPGQFNYLSVGNGGTGARNATAARANLGAAASGVNSDITELTGLTVYPGGNVSQGGTGRTTLTNHGTLIGAGTSGINATSTGTAGQVLTSNGPGSDPTYQDAGGGGGGSSAIKFAQISITDSEFADTYTTPIEILPAITPSSHNIVYTVHRVVVSMNYTYSGDYTDGGDLQIVGATSGAVYATINKTAYLSTSPTNCSVPGASLNLTSNYFDAIYEGLVLKTTTSDPTSSGTSFFLIDIYYSETDLGAGS